MSVVRATTNGVLKSYRYDLLGSFTNLNNARDKVLSQRNFNSFSEDPATAAQCFQLRRAFQRTDSQYNLGDSVVRKYEVAYSSLESVVNLVDNTDGSALEAIVRAENSPTAGAVVALGQSLKQTAKSIVQAMNGRYGENYVFSGADGLKVPFEWKPSADGTTEELYYRGVAVDTEDDPTLAYMSNEKKFQDIGIGLSEDANGNLVESGAFDSALQGINYLGYGKDDAGYANNIASVLYKMGEILERCDAETGAFANPDDKANFEKLYAKFEAGRGDLKDKHVELSTRANFLKTNQEELANTAYTLNEQINGIEQVDLADAITAFSWAQYCYNAALKVGNSILSQSLMDYMN